MTKHPSYRARDQPESGSASQHRKDKIMHKFEKRDAKSRTLVILAVVGLAAAITVGIFTAVRNNLRIGRHKQDIIKCNAIANNLTHYITLTFVNFKHWTLKTV